MHQNGAKMLICLFGRNERIINLSDFQPNVPCNLYIIEGPLEEEKFREKRFLKLIKSILSV